MTVSATTTSVLGQQGTTTPSGYDAFKQIDMDEFIALLVAELSNQDPLEPMDNSEILQQVSQIREIASNDLLSETLDAVLLGQNLATASSLLGQQVCGQSDSGESVAGLVDQISIDAGVTKLHVGDQVLALENVSEVLPPDGEDSQGTGTQTDSGNSEVEGSNEEDAT